MAPPYRPSTVVNSQTAGTSEMYRDIAILTGKLRIVQVLKGISERHSQGGDAPVGATLLARLDEQRQADEVDGGGDGQRADEPEDQAHQAGHAQEDLEERRHQDGPLDLWTARRRGQYRKVSFDLDFWIKVKAKVERIYVFIFLRNISILSSWTGQ